MFERSKKIAAVATVGAVGFLALWNTTGGEKSDTDNPHVVGTYYGRPGVPKNDTLNKLTRLGNWDVAVYSDNRATFKIVGVKGVNLMEGTMSCVNDDQLHITAEPVPHAGKVLGRQVPLVEYDKIQDNKYSRTACVAGAVSVDGMDRINTFERTDA
jgi:hypothetical protein